VAWPSLPPSCGLSGAAGQLLHVLAECLRREFESLDHGEIGKQLVGQVLRRHPGPDGQRRRLDKLARFRSHCLHADQPVAALFSTTSLTKPRVSKLASARGTFFQRAQPALRFAAGHGPDFAGLAGRAGRKMLRQAKSSATSAAPTRIGRYEVPTRRMHLG